MLIEELQKLAGPAPLPAFDPAHHAKLYKAQPKERRRVVNALYRAGGTMEYARLLSETSTGGEPIRTLSDLGLIALLPDAAAPATAVLPLERLFATPLAENEPDKLVEALKIYSMELLWTLCSLHGIPMNGAREVDLRARLYRWSSTEAPLRDLDPSAADALSLLRKHGWCLEGERLFRALGLPPPPGGRSSSTLFGAPTIKGRSVETLLHRLLLVPVRETPGLSYYRNLAVPLELRPRLEPLLRGRPSPAPSAPPAPGEPREATRVERAAPSPPPRPPPPQVPPSDDCVSGKTLALDSREGLFPGELARLLLLAEADPISVTQKGTLNRRDLRRLTKSWIPDEFEADRLLMLATSAGCFEASGETSRLSPRAAEAFADSAESLARRVLGAFPLLFVNLPGGWIPESTFRDLTKLALRLGRRSLLEGATVCVHCMAQSLLKSPDLPKHVLRATWMPQDFAKRLIQAMLELLHQAGIAAMRRVKGRVVAAALTPTGRAALADEKGPAPSRPAGDADLVVQPSGEIIAPRTLDFEELRRLARAAEVKSVDSAVVFAMTRKSLLRAAQRGEDLAALKVLLERRSKTPVPQTVRFQIDELLARQGEVEVVRCEAVVTARDPSILKALGSGVRILNDTTAILARGYDPEDFLAHARKLGYLPRTPAAAATAEPPEPGPGMRKGRILDELESAFELELAVRVDLRDGRSLTLKIRDVDDDRLVGTDSLSRKEFTILIRDIVQVIPLDT